VPLRERLHRLADALLVLSGGPEAEEGIRAFFEKRPPVW
jgi:enoyl-CoA hydratase/carnithine racemase